MTDEEIAFGELRGCLLAFARFNDKTNHGCTFTFDCLPQATSVRQSLERFFRRQATKVVLTQLEDWSQTVRALFQTWFFQFQVPLMGRLVDRGKTFSLSHDSGRESLLDWVMNRLEAVVGQAIAWKVDVQTSDFYECGWDDVAFETAEGSYLLHFGVSD